MAASVFDSPTDLPPHELLQEGYNHSVGWYPLLDMFESISYHSHLTIAAIMSVILALAISGNLTVIVVFLRDPKLRSPSNLLIVNLAVANLLMALTGFPLLISNSIHGTWAYPIEVCHFYGASATMFGLMSINTMMFISLDRLVVISSPENLLPISYKNVAFCIAVTWVYSAAWASFPLLGWNRYIIEGYGTTCSIDYFTREAPDCHFLLAMFLGDYIFPILIITVCYTKIFRSVRKHSANIKHLTPLGRKKQKQKWSTDYKVTKMSLVVVVMYCLTWTPYAVVVLIGQYGDLHSITPTNSMLPTVFAKLSTICNPIIYGLSHTQFKGSCQRILIQLNLIRNRNGHGNFSGNTHTNKVEEDGQSNQDANKEGECREPMVDMLSVC